MAERALCNIDIQASCALAQRVRRVRRKNIGRGSIAPDETLNLTCMIGQIGGRTGTRSQFPWVLSRLDVAKADASRALLFPGRDRLRQINVILAMDRSAAHFEVQQSRARGRAEENIIQSTSRSASETTSSQRTLCT